MAPKQTLATRIHELGVTRDFLRRTTAGPDTLFSPLTPTREALYSDEPPCVVVRGLFCGVPVLRKELAQAIHCEAGAWWLNESTPGYVICPFHVRLVRELLLFSDYIDSAVDAVMGAGETTAILYDASRPERRVKRVLDVGCGAGTLALLLARDADEVVGVDINPRAVMLADRNAQANGIENVEFRVGDLYAPVNGESFDLIVSQPPYYPAMAAGKRQTFLHGGDRGDEIARAVVVGISDHLTPGGRAFIFASWPIGGEAIRVPDCVIQEMDSDVPEIEGTRQTLTVIERRT